MYLRFCEVKVEPYRLHPLPGEDDNEPWVAPKPENCATCQAQGQRQCFIHARELPPIPDDDFVAGRCRHCDRWCGKRLCDQCWSEKYDARPDAHVGASYLYERI